VTVAAAPTSFSDRLPLLDATRGVALLGIFTLNLAPLSGFIFLKPEEMSALPTAAVDLPAALLILWFGHGKFYSLFSLLFGIGFAMQMESAARAGDQRLRRFRRRLLVLLAIGFIHLTFIWEGDILALYALVGFALIPLRSLSQRALLTTSAVLLVLPVVEQALIVASHGALDPGAPLLEIGRRWQIAMGFGTDAEPYPVLKYASFTEALRFQLSGIWFRYADLLTTGRPFKVLAMFVLGLWVGRSGLLRDIEPWVPLLRRVRLVCLAVGLPAALVQALMEVGAGPRDSPLQILASAAYALGVAPLAVAYGAHLALLWRRAIWRDRLAWAIAPGRMALTNYLMQTVIGIALFYGIGLGLMGELGPVTWPLIAGVVVAFQAAVSWWWLGRFPFGPMEWLWRRATYGRFSPDSSSATPSRLP
jgi:uncharacterized protein